MLLATRMAEYVDLNLTLKIQTTALRVMRRLPWKGMALRSIMKPLNHASNAIRLPEPAAHS
ncbi:hypothetical protein [Nocardia sp.]|uniref:hypothetical protein n=1 Tax=Nocardia sp. TaxID=1821 RepID=UPI00260CB401|nr:hypothetical protein [Nocardia sp.]